MTVSFAKFFKGSCVRFIGSTMKVTLKLVLNLPGTSGWWAWAHIQLSASRFDLEVLPAKPCNDFPWQRLPLSHSCGVSLQELHQWQTPLAKGCFEEPKGTLEEWPPKTCGNWNDKNWNDSSLLCILVQFSHSAEGATSENVCKGNRKPETRNGILNTKSTKYQTWSNIQINFTQKWSRNMKCFVFVSAEQSWPRSPCSNYPKHKGWQCGDHLAEGLASCGEPREIPGAHSLWTLRWFMIQSTKKMLQPQKLE